MLKRNNSEVNDLQFQFGAIIQGMSLALLVLLIFAIILALLTHFSVWQGDIKLFRFLAYAGVFIGSVQAGYCCYRRSWIHGLAVGFLIFLFLAWIANTSGFFLTWRWFKGLLKVSLITFLGGILGGLFSN